MTPTPSPPSAITALSPLDGRYAGKLGDLRAIMSEHGYMKARVQVEITWLLANLVRAAPTIRPANGPRTLR